MPKNHKPAISVSEKDAKFLRKVAPKLNRTYFCTFIERFIVCFEKHNGKYFYYALDTLTGKFSLVLESSFQRSLDSVEREMLPALKNSVKYTGIFNRFRIPGKPGLV